MKNQIALLLFTAGTLLLSCNNKKSTISSDVVAQDNAALMLIPESADTLLDNGRRNIFLVNRRENKGYFVERSIFPAGYKSNPHTHPGNLNITVITGSFNLAINDNYDSPEKPLIYGPGSFVIIPAGVPHFEWFTEKTVMDISGVGPLKTVHIPIIH